MSEIFIEHEEDIKNSQIVRKYLNETYPNLQDLDNGRKASIIKSFMNAVWGEPAPEPLPVLDLEPGDIVSWSIIPQEDGRVLDVKDGKVYVEMVYTGYWHGLPLDCFKLEKKAEPKEPVKDVEGTEAMEDLLREAMRIRREFCCNSGPETDPYKYIANRLSEKYSTHRK